MAQLLPRTDLSDLTLRVVSAAVLLPLSLFAIWGGGWYFAALVLVLAGAMSWEWSSLCRTKAGPMAVVFATVLWAAGLTFVGFLWEALLCMVLGALSLALVSRIGGEKSPILLPAGTAYLSFGVISIVWLRASDPAGLAVFNWMIAIVIATDIGAYFMGRAIGGPKMAPRISPGKTWSGLAGGVVCAALSGVLTVHLLDTQNYILVGVLSGGMAVVAQGGDLIESAVKRHFGVKDAGNLIPGHGGALDRFDGFLTVAPVTALMMWISGGSPLEWQL